MRKVIEHLRDKPLHIRERILILAMAVAAPVLITVWYVSFSSKPADDRISTIEAVSGTIQSVTTNPEFADTFQTPSLSPREENTGSTQTGNAIGATGGETQNPDSELYPGYDENGEIVR